MVPSAAATTATAPRTGGAASAARSDARTRGRSALTTRQTPSSRASAGLHRRTLAAARIVDDLDAELGRDQRGSGVVGDEPHLGRPCRPLPRARRGASRARPRHGARRGGGSCRRSGRERRSWSRPETTHAWGRGPDDRLKPVAAGRRVRPRGSRRRAPRWPTRAPRTSACRRGPPRPRRRCARR